MSAVNQYKHKLLGFIECPSTFDFVYLNPTREIPVYKLLEDIPVDEGYFDGKRGDILVGGGSGEAPAFRITFPSAFYFFTSTDWDEFNGYDDLFKAFWTPTQSFILCEGFSKLVWTADEKIELWLAEQMCQILINGVEEYCSFKMDSSPSRSNLKFKVASLNVSS